MKYFIQTFGCQMNVADSNGMAEYLALRGLEPADGPRDADVVVVNTCSVRDHAEHRAISFVGRVQIIKKKLRPGMKIIMAGCAAERLGEQLKRQLPLVDLVIGSKEVESFPERVGGLLENTSPHPVLLPRRLGPTTRPQGEKEPGGGVLPRPAGEAAPVSGFVTIMRGCENFCSYCIVPYVRGEEKSRTPEEIVREIEALVKRGMKDVTLLGQNVNSYRGVSERTGETVGFPGLLALVNAIEGLLRIRFMTSHPKDLSDELIAAVAGLDKVCEHVHLPVQSGSDAVLRAMNRGYTAAEYLRIVEKIRRAVPGAAVTTDILIGFPGETAEDFERTLELIRAVEFDFLFAFKYSPRPGTAAERLGDDVPRETKEARHQAVLELVNGISAAKNAKLMGTGQEVLVDGRSEDLLVGLTRTNKKVYIPAECQKKDLAGSVARVTITGARVNSLTGLARGENSSDHG